MNPRIPLFFAATFAAFALVVACSSSSTSESQDPDAPLRWTPDGGIVCAEQRTACGTKCVDTLTNASHCGACGAVCPSGDPCVNGKCGGVKPDCRENDTCPAGTYCYINDGTCRPGCSEDTNCGSNEVCDVATRQCKCAAGKLSCGGACVTESVSACGASCTACPAVPNGTPVCNKGVCGATCTGNAVSCNGKCEVDNPAACGASCTSCPVPVNATPSCKQGACGSACKLGFSACAGGGGRCGRGTDSFCTAHSQCCSDFCDFGFCL